MQTPGQITTPTGPVAPPSSDEVTTPGGDITATGSSAPGPGPVPAGLEKYYAQTLDWGDCEPYATTDDDKSTYNNPDLKCARLTVPMDYSDPSGSTITIGVLRKAATGADPKGSVLFNPGGPGASGMSIVATIAEYDADPTLNDPFNLVGFDPRGVGSSLPAIVCQTDEQRDQDRADNWPSYMRTRTPAEVDAANDRTKQYVQHCIQRTGEGKDVGGAPFLAQVGTTSVARDMDVLRAVLGDSKLTYVGWSYGTSIGTVYAEKFPANVRAMILDGAVNPDEDAATDSINQATAFQKAFGTFATWCTKRVGCVLGSDPSKTTEVFQHLTRPLLDKPITVTDGRVLSYSDAITGTAQALYSDSLWPSLATGLLNLSKGDGGALMTLADQYEDRDGSGHYSAMLDAFNAIRCMDKDRITDPAKVLQLNEKLNQVAPFWTDGDPAAAVFDVCAYWPAEPTLTPHVPKASGLAPVLVISTTGDPATPYQDGVDLAGYLKGALLTVKGTRHTGYMLSGLTCVDKAGDDYLINLTLPAKGATCS